MTKLSNILTITNSAITETDERAQIVSLNRLEAEMKFRIFNKGEATDGSAIGQYRSDQYKKQRQAAGRQTGYKDLEFNSDLRRSIQKGKTGNLNTLGFTNDKARLIAEAQQTPRQTGKVIFSASRDELALAIQSYNDEIDFALTQGLSNV